MLTYSELKQIDSFEGRLAYLRVDGVPAEMTYGTLRYLNQGFYRSSVWRTVRESVIRRDLGYDLGIPGREIIGRVIVHHMNPLKPRDILVHSEFALNSEFLITVSHETHQAIHFGSQISEPIVERFSGDTKLW